MNETQASERLRSLARNRRPGVSTKHSGPPVGYGRPNAMPRKTPREDDDLEELDRAAAPRPKVADGQDASRGKRMFAGLLGTLRQSKSREEKEREILEKRKTIVAAVSGKSEEISRELKEAQYKAFIEKRDADEKVKFELDLKFKETEREYIEAQYAEWKGQLDEEGAILTMTETARRRRRSRRPSERNPSDRPRTGTAGWRRELTARWPRRSRGPSASGSRLRARRG